jgi:hypothetical protein
MNNTIICTTIICISINAFALFLAVTIILLKKRDDNFGQCSFCDGVGKHYYQSTEKYHKCPICKGTGKIRKDKK